MKSKIFILMFLILLIGSVSTVNASTKDYSLTAMQVKNMKDIDKIKEHTLNVKMLGLEIDSYTGCPVVNKSIKESNNNFLDCVNKELNMLFGFNSTDSRIKKVIERSTVLNDEPALNVAKKMLNTKVVSKSNYSLTAKQVKGMDYKAKSSEEQTNSSMLGLPISQGILNSCPSVSPFNEESKRKYEICIDTKLNEKYGFKSTKDRLVTVEERAKLLGRDDTVKFVDKQLKQIKEGK